MNHPFITFRGVNAHLDVQFTFAHGVAASQCQVRVPPTPGIEEGGTLIFIFGGTRIEFPQCKVDRIDVARNPDGLMVWTLTILDRRWKWKECGTISGYYNVRESENANADAGIPKQIKKGTEKNVRALMKLCLEAMGEKGYSIAKVPDDIFPEVEWDYELPAQALAKLADTIKFRVVLNWRRNRVELWPDGEGQKLTTQNSMEYQITVDPPERPDQLIFAGHRMLWEQDLELEAVCRSQSDEYLPINHPAIQFKPDTQPIDGNFWWYFDPEFGNAIFDKPVTTIHGIKTLRDLAKADVYRKYRIKVPFFVQGGVKGGHKMEDLDRILPLLSSRLTTQTPIVAAKKPPKVKPPIVWGLFTRDTPSPEYWKELNDTRSKLDKDGNPPKEMSIEDGFQVDEKTGIVAFDKPRYQFGKKPGGIEVDGKTVDWPYTKPAKLFLRIGFGVRDKDTRGWIHEEIVRRSRDKKFGTQPRYVTAADAIFRTIATKSGAGTNRREYEKMAKHYLDVEERRYETRDPCAATYPGLLPIVPDGAIQQITWSIAEQGATTRVSRNREEPVLGLTYEEQRLYQQLREKLATDPKTSREADDKRVRRPA
ncbi:MAG: hypothetical protein L0211_09135 [Planctomycetaceae bacterium]|nr:hypothetical protein [Planctomycetaceae bacterium]